MTAFLILSRLYAGAGLATLVALFAAVFALAPMPAAAAAICTLNPQTGLFESRQNGQVLVCTAPAPKAAPLPPAAAAAAPAPANEKRQWDVRLEDRSIHGALARWGAQATPRRQIAWELPREFIITASDSDRPFYGTFEDAVDRVLDSYAASDYPPKGCFYSNGVLRIVRRIDDGLECKR